MMVMLIGTLWSRYYFKHLVGIQQPSTSRGWDQITVKPTVWIPARNESVCANLSSARGSVVTSRGALSVQWTCGSPAHAAPAPTPIPGVVPAVSNSSVCLAETGRLGGNVVEQWSADRSHEIGSLYLSCEDGGTMKAIEFASFGTPTGNCSAGFTRASTCDENKEAVAAKVAAECVGKESCVLTASSSVFGDPCVDHIKSLAVIATGCKGKTALSPNGAPSTPPTAPLFTLAVVVPLGATAELHLPTMGLADGQARITEAGAAVWANGTLLPGVSGVLAASKNAVDGTVVVRVGSGSYSFHVVAELK